MIEFAAITTNEIVFVMRDDNNNRTYLISYTLKKGKYGNELVRNGQVEIPTVDNGTETTKFRRAWSYASKIYYVVTSTDNSTGAATESNICIYDSKLKKLLQQRANPNPGDILCGQRGVSTAIFALPPTYILDDYNVTEADTTITRHVDIYKLP